MANEVIKTNVVCGVENDGNINTNKIRKKKKPAVAPEEDALLQFQPQLDFAAVGSYLHP